MAEFFAAFCGSIIGSGVTFWVMEAYYSRHEWRWKEDEENGNRRTT